MKVYKAIIGLLFLSIFSSGYVHAQTISKDELIFLTSQWKGERFADGRPKVPDDLLVRARDIGIDDAWTVLKNLGYTNQFEGGWKMVNDSTPVIGRAVTAMYLPSRPDVEASIKERGLKEGRKGNTNSWPIDVLTKGDVYVADGFGKIAGGTGVPGSYLISSVTKTGLLNALPNSASGISIAGTDKPCLIFEIVNTLTSLILLPERRRSWYKDLFPSTLAHEGSLISISAVA